MMLDYIHTKGQYLYILVKALSRGKFEFHRGRIGVAENPFLLRVSAENGNKKIFLFNFYLIKLE